MDFHIRRARLEDADAIRRTHKAAVLELCAGFYADKQLTAWAEALRPDMIVRVMSENSLAGFVAEGGGEILGYSVLDDDRVRAVYVHPDHARCGVGTVLLRAVEAEAAGKGVQVLRLRASLNSVRFYEACGYEAVRKVKRELPFSEAMECMEMEKRVS